MYPTSGATIRHDLNQFVQEASQADKFFIASRVLPPIAVEAKAGSYPRIRLTAGELMTPNATARSRGSSYGRTTRAWETDTYDCVDNGSEEALDDTDASDLARFNMETDLVSKLVYRQTALKYEIRAAAALLNTTNFGSATNSAVAYTEANIATINFQRDIGASIRRLRARGALANTVVMSGEVLERVARGTLTVNFVRGSISGAVDMPITAENIQRALADQGITQVLVGDAYYNAAKKGATHSGTSVWGTTYVWVGSVAPGNSTMAGGAGYTLFWNADGNSLFTTETYREEDIRSTIYRVRQNTAEKIVDGTAGDLIATQWA